MAGLGLLLWLSLEMYPHPTADLRLSLRCQVPTVGRGPGAMLGNMRAQELLRGLNLGGRRPAVAALAVALALEGKASHRELTSRLLAELVGPVVTPEDVAWAFDAMLRDLPDLILDTPDAPQVGNQDGAGQGHGCAAECSRGHITAREAQSCQQFSEEGTEGSWLCQRTHSHAKDVVVGGT